jgi:hypothetical protein
MASFQTVHFREQARVLMHQAINAAGEAVKKDVMNTEEADKWYAVYTATIAAEPNETVRELCHQMRRRKVSPM